MLPALRCINFNMQHDSGCFQHVARPLKIVAVAWLSPAVGCTTHAVLPLTLSESLCRG